MVNELGAKRLGLSLRIANAEKYFEERDAISHDWYQFMSKTLPEISWLLLPNLGSDIVGYLQKWDIDSVILTGGNDLGSAPRRDETENSILNFAIQKKIPVFGICRGLQVIQNYYGREVRPHNSNLHVGKEHLIQLTQSEFVPKGLDQEYEVNSFHNFGVRKDELADGLEPIALTTDGEWVEGLIHKQHRVGGIQWHPERKEKNPDLSHKLIRSFFALKGEQ
ncbi:MAG: gamma-glutamyl-gamma-aminobutyrate hydrolase family protein [Pseudomonadota bacterium]|nr:gamma-glutamyl-gamma-aminobutyrate hydrolase family protein [Pseudomonadota bacterium]